MQYHQEKLNTSHQLKSSCDLNLEINSKSILYRGEFFMEFKKDLVPYGVTFIHELHINKENGDIFVTYDIVNHKYDDGAYKNTSWIRKNNFDKLYDLTESGFYRGEKRRRFWGAKYDKVTLQFFNTIKKDLQKEFTTTFLGNKNYREDTIISGLYDLVVDYHLYKKQIKPHNNVYTHIMSVYPRKKWLKLNGNKFLPAILDQYGVKSKFLIKELSNPKSIEYPVNIKALFYLCGLFGDNYVDYIKKFNWEQSSSGYFTKPKKHRCKNESEKRMLVNMFLSDQNATTDGLKINDTLEYLYDLFEVRKFLETRGYKNLKMKIRVPEDVSLQLECWRMLKRHATLGYMLRFKIPDEVVQDIEQPIEIYGEIFRPKVLTTNDDFCIEGLIMRNCMAKQFNFGSIYIYVALTNGKKRINIQYRRGMPIMAFAKANSPVPEVTFKPAMCILNDRMLKYQNISWKREKYNIISNC
jgi:hypothetical protein